MQNDPKVSKVIGINIPFAAFASCAPCEASAMDGGACLVCDGVPVTAISEERLSRKKYDGDFVKSLYYCLKANDLTLADIDLFAFSFCGRQLSQSPKNVNDIKGLLIERQIDIPAKKILLVPSHSLSHAYSAYYASGMDSALVFVLDDEGTSVYLSKDGVFDDVTSALGEQSDAIGKDYAYYTKQIGYPSYQDFGKTMALAPYGKSSPSPAITAKSADLYQPTPYQKGLAWQAQQKLESASLSLIKNYIAKFNQKNICLAGLAGLNCVNNYHLIKHLDIDNFFVQPACADTGQCLGNAFYGYWLNHPKRHNPYKPYKMQSAYLGRQYSKDEVQSALREHSDKTFTTAAFSPDKVAALLAQGKVIGLSFGKSEFGPRALGHRSIIADPSNPRAKATLDAIKQREYYRPYAPSVLAEYASDFFDTTQTDRFMLFATKVKEDMRHLVPNIVHIDGSSRIQIVNKEDAPIYHQIIKSFYDLSGIPMVLNTSFNTNSEPIVETPSDALRTFFATDLDALVLDNMIIY